MSQVVLIVTTVTAGLIAGLFFGFSISVMVSLRQVDDRVFVDTMQKINRLIQNGLFGLVFMAALLGSIALIVIELGADATDWLVIGGSVLYLLSMVITMGGNIPMNNRLEAAGPVSRMKDPAAARRAFEGPWTRLNHLRGLAATAGFTLYILSF